MTQIATTTPVQNRTRVIFKCQRKSCKHVWAKEYREMVDRETGKRNGTLYYMEEIDGMRVRHYYSDDINGRCPTCNSPWIDGNRVTGTVSNHVCNAKCMGATSGTCECSCGGQNHGISHM